MDCLECPKCGKEVFAVIEWKDGIPVKISCPACGFSTKTILILFKL